jgi:hypothetical protein
MAGLTLLIHKLRIAMCFMSAGSTGMPVSCMFRHLGWLLRTICTKRLWRKHGPSLVLRRKMKLSKNVCFHSFRDQLAMQGLRYNPEDKRYKGDLAMRVNTKRRKGSLKEGERRGVGCPRKCVTPGDDNEAIPKVTLAQLNQLKRPFGGRLCGDLNKYMLHRQSIETLKHKVTCKFCGKFCFTRCKICGLAAHDNPQRGKHIGNDCFTKLHNDHCFGLAVTDCKLLKTDKNMWKMPTKYAQEKIRVTSKTFRGRSRTVYVKVLPQLRIAFET